MSMNQEKTCKSEPSIAMMFREEIPEITEAIIRSCEEPGSFTHINHEPIPSRQEVVFIVHALQKLIFPGYFSRETLDATNLRYKIGHSVSRLFDALAQQIIHSLRHDCFRYDQSCIHCTEQGYETARKLFRAIPELRRILTTDVHAAYDGDPAASSHDEIIFSYPGIFAIYTHRIATILYKEEVPFIPRIMSEYAHSVTGIDIHPGATIGERFAIDHGTGVVIGETTQIGRNVRIYQGVTLGALSLPPDAGNRLRGKKRHPTIEDDVIIYSGTTILGGNTVIGARSVIGGNVWLTESVPPDTLVVIEAPRLTYRASDSLKEKNSHVFT
ncbi:serine acetyltransferase [Desulfobotulus sp. H1]|uniref:Serine acetyltransferase n=1 Tax=Desulfobotulus pelophilus TaxID=2823377 RepID=A0ABT3NBP2_9BACT|nr:serine O-acetyltransferase EpsC [Desulfobotulus pelophilus]MCW7754591.1 serine acetyltransferase [Desulfobotulus pelophilus]